MLNQSVFKGKHGDMNDETVKKNDQEGFERTELEELFLTIERNTLQYRTKENILDILEGKKNKGAIKKETRIVGKNTKQPIQPPSLKPARNREDAQGSMEEDELAEIKREQQMALEKQKQKNKKRRREPKQEPDENDHDDQMEVMLKEAEVDRELRELRERNAALEKQNKKLKLKKKREKQKKFEQEQSRRRRKQIEERSDVSDSEYDGDSSEDGRQRHNSTE